MQSHYSTFPAILLATSLSLTLLTACGGSGATVPTVSSKLTAIWEHTGYGNIYEINETGGTAYQYTRATCLKVDEFDNEDIQEVFANGVLSSNKLNLEVGSSNSSFVNRYQRLENIPETCQGNGLITTATLSKTFQHFWHTYNDYYTFFNERNVDWESRYNEFAGLISDDMDDEDLFELLANILTPLDDAHVKLIADDNTFTPLMPKGANRVILEAFPQQNEYSELQTFANVLSDQYEENLQSYLDPQSVKTVDQRLSYLQRYQQ